MKYCVIAIKENNNYRSIICHCDEYSDIGLVLRNKYHSETATSNLIALGDLNQLDENTISSFHEDWGYQWNETTPITHENLKLLALYSDAVGADRLHVFEDNEWESLVISEPEELLKSA